MDQHCVVNIACLININEALLVDLDGANELVLLSFPICGFLKVILWIFLLFVAD